MAAFRSVCAEEEAATALISSLKVQKYPGSEHLNFRSHADKHAVIIFVSTVMAWFDEMKALSAPVFSRIRIHFIDIGKRRGLGITLELSGSDKALQPTPPLHVLTSDPTMMADRFKQIANEVLGTESIAGIKEKISKRANFRNTILYAAPNGLPRPKGDVSAFIANQAGVVNSLLTALALIDPWRKPKYPHSGVVISLIDVFAKIMEKIKTTP